APSSPSNQACSQPGALYWAQGSPATFNGSSVAPPSVERMSLTLPCHDPPRVTVTTRPDTASNGPARRLAALLPVRGAGAAEADATGKGEAPLTRTRFSAGSA